MSPRVAMRLAIAALGLCASAALSTLLAGCGGGGSGSNNQAPAAAASTGVGSGSGSGPGAAAPASTSGRNVTLAGATTPASNQVPVTIGPYAAAGRTANLPYVTVTVCNATGRCVKVDHVVLDTGSYGLRVMAAAVAGLGLSPLPSASGTLAECAYFLSGTTWGSVAQATVQMGGEVARSVPIQVVGDSAAGAPPSACTNHGADQGSLTGLGGNGLLGVGLRANDVGTGSYFVCSGAACSRATTLPPQPVANPVWQFASDNNGVIVQLPAVGRTGAATATGLLTFGIDTEPDNSIANFALVAADAKGNFTATLQGSDYGSSFIDSGSNFTYATLSGPTVDASRMYAPASYTTYPVQLKPNVGSGPTVTTEIAAINPSALNFNIDTAFDDVVSPGSAPGANGSVDLGLNSFYGHAAALLFTGKSCPQGRGPLYALK
jgi:hypothetical protein